MLRADLRIVTAHDDAGRAADLASIGPADERPAPSQEEHVNTTRRAAGLGLLAYGLGTPVAFMASGSPGGDYDAHTITSYISSGHWPTAIAFAYLGAFSALGLLLFGSRMRRELDSGGDLLWGLSVAGAGAAVVGWFLVGGVAVAFAEGGSPLGTVPHPAVYMVTEMSNLVAVCSSAFLVGAGALVLAAKAALPAWLRVLTSVAGVCGLAAAFFFPVFLFWLWAVLLGGWTALSSTRSRVRTEAGVRQPA